ncbi:hypothetical protein BDV96DRAFT_644487 [Lophiotrema nucula]|uniref:DUF7779 domain-containing protein n=1 Tax=Lophiotrema nucula TaxID=690887 RepID=A0A6A5ZC55_9PLEO|nr:hypothetical protein BDV96DRAFT_644487 [Lophiotrema nucula]
MATLAELSKSLPHTFATVQYMKNDEKYKTEKPYYIGYTVPLADESQRSNHEYDSCQIRLHDVRAVKDQLGVKRNAFEMLTIPPSLMDQYFFDDDNKLSHASGAVETLKSIYSTDLVFCQTIPMAHKNKLPSIPPAFSMKSRPKQRERGVKAIFWIRSEDKAEADRSFTEISGILGLSGATTSIGHDQKRLLVLQWLQKTATPWLLIFDNLESQKPFPDHASLLSELLATSACTIPLEVPSFSRKEGANLILKELDKTDVSPADQELALKISDHLGGHALAIDVMARYMLTRKKSLSKFLAEYKANPRSIQKKRAITNIYYEHPLDGAWALAFGQLEPTVSKLFGIISMVGPDRLPVNLLADWLTSHTDEDEECNDLDDYIFELKDRSLVGTSDDQQMIFVHRLLQLEFRARMGQQECFQRWKEVVIILFQAFPTQNKGATLMNQWKVCEKLIEHVEISRWRYREMRNKGVMDCVIEFASLACNASRLLNVITAAMWERGLQKGTLVDAQRVVELRRRLLPANDPDIAIALSNNALLQVSTGDKLNDAVQMLEEALKIDGLCAEEDRRKAKEELTVGIKHVEEEFGKNARYFTIIYRMMADVKMKEGRLQAAYEHLENALHEAQTDNATNPWVSTALYRMGGVRLKQQKFDEAIDLLRRAEFITRS